jgi:hypothetical protein
MSFANVNSQNVELTPCRVEVSEDAGATFIDLGGTEGGVKINAATTKSPIKFDQLAEFIVDAVNSGMATLTVETILSEYKDKVKTWKQAFPNSKLIQTINGDSVYFDSQVGVHDLSKAVQLKLHPLSLDDIDLSGNHLFYKAVAKEISEVTFSPTKQIGLKITWQIYIDTSTLPARFWLHGDPENGLVPASVGSAVFTGSGNGTLTNLSAGAKAKDENITIKCIGKNGSDTGAFSITGSISGLIGVVSLPGTPGGSVNFTSAPDILSFTITDGSVDFLVDDQWVVPTTAANYS